MKLLLLTKDLDYTQLAVAHFKENTIEFFVCDSLQEAVFNVENNGIEIVICDASFGSISIVQVAEILRKSNENIVMVSLGTCFGDTNLSSFYDSGIKEFICKKADLKLSEQRITQVYNAAQNIPSNVNLKILKSVPENLEINIEQNTIYLNSKAIHITQLEFNLLVLFLNNKNKLLKRQDIIENIWLENQEDANLRKVDSFVKKIRQKLNLKSIKSIRGLGYKWVE